MAKFRVTVKVTESYDVDVEAKDEFEADDIVTRMELCDVRAKGNFCWSNMDIPDLGEKLE